MRLEEARIRAPEGPRVLQDRGDVRQDPLDLLEGVSGLGAGVRRSWPFGLRLRRERGQGGPGGGEILLEEGLVLEGLLAAGFDFELVEEPRFRDDNPTIRALSSLLVRRAPAAGAR